MTESIVTECVSQIIENILANYPSSSPDPASPEVGVAIEIYWPRDRAWYRCVVTSYNEASAKHEVRHVDDGEIEHLDLQLEEWRYPQAPDPASPEGAAAIDYARNNSPQAVTRELFVADKVAAPEGVLQLVEFAATFLANGEECTVDATKMENVLKERIKGAKPGYRNIGHYLWQQTPRFKFTETSDVGEGLAKMCEDGVSLFVTVEAKFEDGETFTYPFLVQVVRDKLNDDILGDCHMLCLVQCVVTKTICRRFTRRPLYEGLQRYATMNVFEARHGRGPSGTDRLPVCTITQPHLFTLDTRDVKKLHYHPLHPLEEGTLGWCIEEAYIPVELTMEEEMAWNGDPPTEENIAKYVAERKEREAARASSEATPAKEREAAK